MLGRWLLPVVAAAVQFLVLDPQLERGIGMSSRMVSPSRAKPIGPSAEASGATCPTHSPVVPGRGWARRSRGEPTGIPLASR